MPIGNQNLVNKLTRSGFSQNEAKVYVTLLELGGAFPSKIAEYAGIKRTTAYNILISLSVRGIVNEIEKRNKQFYQPEKPEKVLRFAKDRIKIAEEGLENIQSVLPDIDGLYGSIGTRPKVTYYEGVEEVKEIFLQMSEVKTIYALVDLKQLFEVIPEEFFTKWRAELRRKSVILKDIVTQNSVELTKAATVELGNQFVQAALPEKYKDVGTDILSWGDNLALISLKHPVTATVIHNADMARTFRMMHDIIWDALQLKNKTA